ncbi:hypothetical protein K438DRAFT_2025150 [Mycena galopus ATCC 62051]|nr:hypothetical protein K438DRAFT_2025150 [Mycena galopus ATCC 62051]
MASDLLSPEPSSPMLPLFSLTAKAHNKPKFRVQHNKKRQDAHMSSANPLLKQVHCKRIEAAKESLIWVNIDAGTLHTPRLQG